MTHKAKARLSPVRALALGALYLSSPAALAQTVRQTVEQPTQGIELPGVALAGEHDALAVAVNPAGLSLLRGLHSAMVLSVMDQDAATSAGQGFGFYIGDRLGGRFLSRFGLGLGLEIGRPSHAALVPDLGTPVRLSLAWSMAMGKSGAIGLSRHLFFDEPGATTHDLRTWDLGLSYRLGAYLAAGAVIRDLGAPTTDGGIDVERRYELELITRPMGTDRLEFALGGRAGELSAHVDGWARLSARVGRGVFLRGEVESRDLTVLTTTAGVAVESEERELVARVGLEVSFGAVGAAFWGMGARGRDSGNRAVGGTVVVRASQEHIPSVLGPTARIAQVRLEGALSERELTSLVLGLRALSRDPGAKALFLAIDDLSIGWAAAQEIWDEVTRVRQSGKRVYAYLVAPSTREYFLATAADRIFIDPAGGLRLSGIAATSVYFKNLFDKLGVTAQFIKIDEYKSAPEAYTRDGPTEPAQRMRDELYDDIYANLVARIAERRKLDPAAVRALIDSALFTGDDLVSSPLVDEVATPRQIDVLVAQDLGQPYRVAGPPLERPDRWALPAIAVIYIDGDIVGGKSRTVPLLGRRLTGGETIAAAIAEARADRAVKAIVLRIDSPGGSALASEFMAREVFQTRGIKPILCSMGDVAASGGYFAAAGCEVIFAQPTTITGSIGIFTGKFDVSGLIARVGLSWATGARGARADMESYFHPYSDEELALIREKLGYLYGRFTDAVSQGRGMTQEQVDAVGRGHVWSGRAAKDVGLVDRLGGLADAIDLAKERAGLGADRRVRIVMLPEERAGLLDLVLGSAGSAGAADGAGDGAAPSLFLPGDRALLGSLPGSFWQEPDEPQARLPFSIIWQ